MKKAKSRPDSAESANYHHDYLKINANFDQ